MTWSIVGDCVAGTSHHLRNTPCQDAFRYRTFGPMAKWLAVAVADGAGSASHSRIGATLACDEFIRLLEARERDWPLTGEQMTGLFAEVRSAVVAEAERLDIRPREMACTLLVAIVGTSSASFAQIGDGVIVINERDGFRTVFWPEPAEYVNTTDFLTDDQFTEKIRFETTTNPVTELAALTDGLQRLALDFAERSPHAAFFRPLFDRLKSVADPESLLQPLRDFLDSPRVNNRTDDDKTLLLAVRRP
ncbi:PP2C family serine/threonine-protein phosphatase [Zavarzinella formosa]|uniref:PP2C family serine/threonine-protein phosphatase n=1 Tax=Zavarzinella formosa TaxID=360055 RepID=UPI00030B7BED|nr:PP2C family serine/threonine-protein phosphatase [Zavarzinella formosa]